MRLPIARALLLAVPGFAQTDVLVLGVEVAGPCCIQDVADKMQATGFFGTVDQVDGHLATVDLATLLTYDAVLVWSDSGGLLNPAAQGDALADYVDAGGGVVTAVFVNTPGLALGGRWVSGGYEPVTSSGQTQGTQEFLGPVLDPGHPVMAGVTSFDGGSSSYQPFIPVVAPGGTVIAQWSDGSTPLVVEAANGQQIDLGFFPVSDNCRSDFWNETTDGDLLMANALVHVSGGFSTPIGTNFCGPANLNSSGAPAVISAFGSETAASNNVRLDAAQMASNEFGYFINSMTQGFVIPPGSQGNLCLGGAIGRHTANVMSTGASGEFSLQLDLNAVPTPGGDVAVNPGETWYWQAWFRDNNPGPTNNFTEGICITFQ